MANRGSPGDGIDRLVARFAGVLDARLRRQRARSSLPLPPEDGAPADDAGPWEVVRLDASSAWETFSARFTEGKRGNLKPWFRCIGVLRGHGAKAAVIERHYVCLDYRSEFASFYSHL